MYKVELRAIVPLRHRFTLRVTRRIVPIMFSAMFVQASERRSSMGSFRVSGVYGPCRLRIDRGLTDGSPAGVWRRGLAGSPDGRMHSGTGCHTDSKYLHSNPEFLRHWTQATINIDCGSRYIGRSF